jgi:hypothetical protein
MRDNFGITLLLMWSICASAQNANTPELTSAKDLQTGYCPQTHQLEAAPSQKFFLEGTIGKRRVRMYLDRGGSGVVGLFFDIGGNWETTLLGGTWDEGHIEASNATELHPATGHLVVSLDNNHLTGSWTSSKSGQAEPVELATVDEPSCDGKEAWKRFDNPDWPVTFSYPSSWHAEISEDDSVVLTCPNPAEIAFDQHITIYHGSGAPQRPTNLMQCGRSWIYGDQCRCDEQDSHRCPTAKVSRVNSATVLDVSEREHRIYCLNGGYVSAGDGEDRVILLGDQWIEINAPANSSEIIKRIAGSLTRRKIQP